MSPAVVPIDNLSISRILDIQRKYKPDFIYKFNDNEWRFTANDGEHIILVNFYLGILSITIGETDYDTILKEPEVLGKFGIEGVQEIMHIDHISDLKIPSPSTMQMAAFFGWKEKKEDHHDDRR